MKQFLHAAIAAIGLLLASARAQDSADPALATPLSGEPVILLKFADGGALWGRIAGHDSERIAFQRLDNGGVARVPWRQLEPTQSAELLETFGYVDHSGDELTLEADRLELDDGTQLIGRIVSRSENEIFVKTARALTAVPKRRVAGAVTTVVVPALDVYTRDELYRAEADKLDPASAASQCELAAYCERILDFARALEHYQKAFELEPGFDGGKLAPTIVRVEEKARNQLQIDYLRDVDSARARGQFDAAQRLLDAFGEKWPDSNLRNEVERKKKQLLKARAQTMRELVGSQWYKWVLRLVEQKARQEGQTLESSLEYLSEKLTEDVLAAVTKDLQRAVGASVTPEEVKKMWDERKRLRFRRASYGTGTWLLGDAAALKEYGEEKPKEEVKPKTGAEAERARLEEKMRRYFANQQTVAKQRATKTSEDEESEQEIFWRTWTSYARGQWLLAYYAENGGDLRIVGEDLSNCTECGGTGTREVVNTGSARSSPSGSRGGQAQSNSGLVIIDCPTCHRIGRVRRVNYW